MLKSFTVHWCHMKINEDYENKDGNIYEIVNKIIYKYIG